jgi:hypothetical protein
MSIQRRLRHLERQARAQAARAGKGSPSDLFTRIDQYTAYLRGQGPRPPDPPCPPGFDPAAWENTLRLNHRLDFRFTGELREGQMTEAEYRCVAEYLQIFRSTAERSRRLARED